MSDEQQGLQPVWEQIPEEEPNLWYSRFLIFRDLGPTRSIHAAWKLEPKKVKKGQKKLNIPPIWYDAAKKFQWHERAAAYDTYRREKVFTEGYAYDLNRIKKLDEIAAKMTEKVEAMLANMKPSKGGFQEFLYTAYLDTLDALAKETGGRAPVGKPDVNVNVNTMQRVVFFDPEAQVGDDIDLEMVPPEQGGTVNE